jgi:hypothetical protein
MRFTFGSWNINKRFSERHVEFLRDADCDLLAVQECTVKVHAELSRAGLFEWFRSSLSLRPQLPGEGSERALGCSIFGRNMFQLGGCDVRPELHLPERSLVAGTLSREGPFTVCSFHVPPATGGRRVDGKKVLRGRIKPETQRAIAMWLAAQDGPVVVGIDANTPKTDHPDHQLIEWWWKNDEPLLLGHQPVHKLRDAFRVYLRDRPEALERIWRERPTGPLAISHHRGSGIHRVDCRYDFVLVSDDIAVKGVEHRLDSSLSDHALVIASLDLQPAQVASVSS